MCFDLSEFRNAKCLITNYLSTINYVGFASISHTKVTDLETHLTGLIFDVSEANNETSYESLSDALSVANNILLPEQKKGGMTIKYIQSSDNKYVQYFLTKNTWSVSEGDWQKMNLEEEVSQLGQKVGDISDILNGSEEEIKTPQTPLSTSGYINCSAAIIGQAYNRAVVASYEGAACWRIPVSIGEKYEILAKGNGNAGALYVLTGNNDIVLAKVGNSESKTTPVILNITQNGFLYVNDMEYSIIPGNVYKVTTQYNDGLIERVEELEEELEESEVVDNLTTADATKALSANQGKIIGDILNGTESTQNTPISLDENAYYNTADGRVNIGAQLSSDGYASKLVEVTPCEQYIICGASSSNATRLYCFADADKVFTYRQQSPIDTRQNPLTITIPDGVAYMVCNFTNYNNQTDGLWRIDTIVTEGLIDKVEDLEKLPWYGKTIVLFGDSIAEGQRYFDTKKRFSDWIEKYTGATVINIAVGGAKIRQHVPPVLNPASQA